MVGASRNVNRETTKTRETFNSFISPGSKGRRMRLIKIYTSRLLLLPPLSATLSRSLVVALLFRYGNNASCLSSFLLFSPSSSFSSSFQLGRYSSSLNVFISLVRRNESNEIVRNIEFYLRRDVSLVNPPSPREVLREKEKKRERKKKRDCEGGIQDRGLFWKR